MSTNNPKQYSAAIREIDSIEEFEQSGTDFRKTVIQGLDLSKKEIRWGSVIIEDTYFVGCKFKNTQEQVNAINAGAIVFPVVEDGRPYNPYRRTLYTWQELNEIESNNNSLDLNIYKHFESRGRHNPDIIEALMQRIHDHAIDDALNEYVDIIGGDKLVGFMGGHGTKRTADDYKLVAETAWLMARAGFTICSGGGPGIMEATNLGAYLKEYDKKDLETALDISGKAPTYDHPDFHKRAEAVIEKFKNGTNNLAVPTWFYGHEPSNLFATHIAKYFSNSIREDGLLAISLGGIVFAPGSAGTTQEIFMDAAQNHYANFGLISSMVFLGKKRYEVDTQIYPLLKVLADGKKYSDMLHLTDSPVDAVNWIRANPPVPN